MEPELKRFAVRALCWWDELPEPAKRQFCRDYAKDLARTQQDMSFALDEPYTERLLAATEQTLGRHRDLADWVSHDPVGTGLRDATTAAAQMGVVDAADELLAYAGHEEAAEKLAKLFKDLNSAFHAFLESPEPVIPPAQMAERPTVAVFGAGIAGLTAAHELAERGFEVTVYELATDERPDPPAGQTESSDAAVKLGGMAASHRAQPPEPDDITGRGEPPQDGVRSVIRPFRPGWGEESERLPTSDAYPDHLPGEHGFRFFPAYYQHIWDMLQRIPVYEMVESWTPTDTEKNSEAVDEGEVPTAENGAGPEGWQLTRSWKPTHRTVFDNIQRVVTQATTTPLGRPSLVFPREAPRSVAEFLGGFGQLREVGFTPADISTFTSRLSRYLSTSPLRRGMELDDISAYEFFVDIDRATGQPMYDYSKAFDNQLINMPKVLAAFDARWGDARTNISTYLQLQLRMDRRDNKADGVLNGPTTEAWFDHWYRCLTDRLGVEFKNQRLVRFEADSGEKLTAIVAPANSSAETGEEATDEVHETYYVVALDAPQAERVAGETAEAELGVGGMIKELAGWTSSGPPESPPRPDEEQEGNLPWPATGPSGSNEEGRQTPYNEIPAYNMSQLGMKPWDRYQTLSGLQFYFPTEFQLVHGHVYYTDSPWALSSINHHGLWEAKHLPNPRKDGFVSVLSVDIGDWNMPSPHVPQNGPECPPGRAAKDCSPDEIAQEVWRQITTSLGNDATRTGQTFPTPVWYTLDRSFKVAAIDKDGKPATRLTENRAPYLVPIVSDWHRRPGGDPWNPHHSSISYRRVPEKKAQDKNERVWVADHGGYEVHADCLVFAGTWTRTFTRMTSMEAACESGRHAVNAILDHFIEDQGGGKRDDDVGLNWRWPFGFLDQSGSGPIRQPTPVGDYCYIFDIENREPAEFRPTRELDQDYAFRGQPHPWELGGIDAQLRTMAGGSGAFLDPAMPLNPNSPDYASWIVGHLRSFRRFLEGLDDQTRSDRRPGPGSQSQAASTAATAAEAILMSNREGRYPIGPRIFGSEQVVTNRPDLPQAPPPWATRLDNTRDGY